MLTKCLYYHIGKEHELILHSFLVLLSERISLNVQTQLL